VGNAHPTKLKVSGVSQTLATEVANWIEKETSALKRSHTKKKTNNEYRMSKECILSIL
jgi:hypothetical protein